MLLYLIRHGAAGVMRFGHGASVRRGVGHGIQQRGRDLTAGGVAFEVVLTNVSKAA